MTKIRALVSKFESSKRGKQVFRFVRLAAIGVVTYAVTHNGVDVAAATPIVETAFRAVFP